VQAKCDLSHTSKLCDYKHETQAFISVQNGKYFVTSIQTSLETSARSYRDYLGRYYTKNPVSSLLVSMMDTYKAGNILDLGSGQGSLSIAASERWRKAKIFSLDIEEQQYFDNRVHHTGDALNYDLPKELKDLKGSIDLAVCNPPYLKAKWRNDFTKVADETGLSRYLSVTKTCPAELIFLAQMIRMLKCGGEAGIILPDGIFTSHKFSTFRDFLISEHCVKKIVELPFNTFKKTEAKTHILIFNKGGCAKSPEKLELRSLLPNGKISLPVHISKSAAIERMDYSYHSKNLPAVSILGKSTAQIAEIASIYRGKHCSAEIKTMSHCTIHTTDIPHCSHDYRLGGTAKMLDLEKIGFVIARPGDVLISRVGRNLHKKMIYIKSGYAVTSDCLFIIRSTPRQGRSIYDHLCSDEGQAHISNLAYGVAARQISMKQILKINVEIV
jgi:type I restriction enzyme M protein